MPTFLANVDLAKNELRNARVQNLATAPSSPVTGQLYFDTDDNTLYYWDSSAWVAAKTGAPSGAAGGDLTGTYPNPTIAAGAVANVDIAAGAAIARSKLDFGSGLVNADIAAAAAIARTKLDFGSGLVNADIAAAAAIAYAKLALTGSIVNADISGSAAIALSKLATDPLARANHTGTQLAATISNFDTQVRTSTLNQMGAPTADLAIGGFKLTGVGTPTADTDAATKAYSDASRAGLDMKQSVRAATTAAGTLASSFESGDVIDGVTLAAGDRILIKNQASGAENGIYVVAASGAPTRATDADASAEVTAGMATWIEEGATQADTRWALTNDGTVTLGSTALVFSQDGGLASVVAGNGLTKSGNTLDAVGTSNRISVAADAIDIAATYVGQTSITTLGTVATGTWNGTDIAVADGGTGASTAAGAKTNLGFMGRYATDIGDGSTTAITVTHNLGTRDVHVSVYQAGSPYAEVIADVEHTTTNTCVLTFAVAPTSAQFRAVIVG